MTQQAIQASRMPPRWVIKTIWSLHRAAYSLTGGRFGLRTPTSERWGMLRLSSVGRRTGQRRVAILGYLEDGANLITPAMNGWADPEPAWWLNLQANPEARSSFPWFARGDGACRDGRGAAAPLVDAQWPGTAAYTDANAALRSRETAIVVLEPRH